MAEPKAVVRKADLLPAPVLDLLRGLIPDCNRLLPFDITEEQFKAALWLELSGRPDLAESPLDDLRTCIVKAATFGLLPGRDCHFLPFRNKEKGGRKCARYVPNYQGILRSLFRTGQVEHAFAEVVYTKDIFELDYGRSPQLIHKPPRKNRGEGEGAYGLIQMKGSRHPLVHYMDPDDLDRVRRRAPAHEQGPWVSDTNEMKRKTAMKNVAKYAPLTPLMSQLLDEDEAREMEDIPQARHQKNLDDLFDNGASASTPVVIGAYDVDTGEVFDVEATRQPTHTPASSQVTGWRRTIERYLIDSDVLALAGKVPPAFVESCLGAFRDAACPDEMGETLAAQVMDWVAAQ